MAGKDKAERAHRATYSTDKQKGGYIIRVEGPQCTSFVGREVPVTKRDGAEHLEKLTRLIWTGVDKESGKPVALYGFEAKPRDIKDEIAF